MKIKKISSILALLLVVALMASCSKPAEVEKKTDEKKVENKEASSEKVEIRFSSWDSSEDLDKQQALVDRFNERQDKIHVVLEAYGDEYDTKIAAGMGSKDAPDVMYMWNYPKYQGALLSLNDLIDAQGADYKSNFYEALWPYNAVEDNIYGIPVGYTTHVLYFNKDLFDEAGVEYPTNDWTWADLEVAAKTISDKLDNVKGFSFSMKPDPYDFEMYLWSNGTAYSGDDGNVAGYVNNEAAVEVLTMFQKMEKEGTAIATEGSGSDEMLGKKIAMYVNGAWPIGTFTEEGLNFGVVKIPKFKEPSVSILSSSGLAISKDSKHPEEAFEFIKYWTSEELNKERLAYELPVLKTVVESENIKDDEIKKVFFDMLEQSSGYVPSSFKMDNWGEFSDELALDLERILNPSSYEDVKSVLDELDSAFAK